MENLGRLFGHLLLKCPLRTHSTPYSTPFLNTSSTPLRFGTFWAGPQALGSRTTARPTTYSHAAPLLETAEASSTTSCHGTEAPQCQNVSGVRPVAEELPHTFHMRRMRACTKGFPDCAQESCPLGGLQSLSHKGQAHWVPAHAKRKGSKRKQSDHPKK